MRINAGQWGQIRRRSASELTPAHRRREDKESKAVHRATRALRCQGQVSLISISARRQLAQGQTHRDSRTWATMIVALDKAGPRRLSRTLVAATRPEDPAAPGVHSPDPYSRRRAHVRARGEGPRRRHCGLRPGRRRPLGAVELRPSRRDGSLMEDAGVQVKRAGGLL